jgi:hypothetical protein
MARFQDTDEAGDGKDVAGHRKVSENDDLAPIGGAAPRQPRIDADDDDTEGHLFGSGPSTQGEAFPHPGDNPHGDR